MMISTTVNHWSSFLWLYSGLGIQQCAIMNACLSLVSPTTRIRGRKITPQQTPWSLDMCCNFFPSCFILQKNKKKKYAGRVFSGHIIWICLQNRNSMLQCPFLLLYIPFVDANLLLPNFREKNILLIILVA